MAVWHTLLGDENGPLLHPIALLPLIFSVLYRGRIRSGVETATRNHHIARHPASKREFA